MNKFQAGDKVRILDSHRGKYHESVLVPGQVYEVMDETEIGFLGPDEVGLYVPEYAASGAWFAHVDDVEKV